MLFSSETTLKNLPILAVLAEGFLQKKFYNINYFWSLQKRGKEKSFYYFFGKLRTRQLFDKTSFENRTSQSTKKTFFQGLIQRYFLPWDHNSSVVLSATTIVRSLVRIPCTPSTFLPFIVKFCTIFVIATRKGRNRQKEARLGPCLLKKICQQSSSIS